MADESQYSSGVDAAGTKRKYEEQTTAPPPPPPLGSRRPTGFSSGPVPVASPESGAAPPPPPSYNSVPPPLDEIQMAKQKAQEIAARLLSGADAKRPRVENGSSFDSSDKGFSSGPSDGKSMLGSAPSTIPVSYGSFQGTSKKIEIPNIRVGVIIGKGGETIKYLQLQSGAKIQVTRDMDADPNAPTRMVELMGTPEQIAKAEQLINEVLQEAEAGGSGVVSRRITGQAGSEQFVMKVPNNKVGLVIGKGGETIKSMQAKSGARIQVIPLHLPPGDTSTDRTVQIDGTSDQIEHAKQLVNEVISGENRLRNPAMGGGYPQQGYQSRPVTGWGPPGAPPMQQPGYGYMQPGAYPGPSPQYGMSQSPYGGYPPQQPQSGYPPNWDASSMPPSQQPAPGGGYDYYSQQPSSQQQSSGGSSVPPDASGYNYYNQPSGYGQQMQGYGQDGYGGYNLPPHSGYGQTQTYDQQQGYGSASGYGSVSNPPREGPYGAQADSSQAPPPGQPASHQYSAGQQPSQNPSGYPQGSAQPGYGVPGYGSQQPPVQPGYGQGYGAQKPVGSYGQAQQSPNAASGGYGLPPPPQAGAYPLSQPPPSSYAQPDPGAQQTVPPPSSYAQPGYAAPPYGAPSSQQGYGQVPAAAYNASYGGGYGQAAVGYSSEGGASGGSGQNAQQSTGAKASPKS